MKLDVKTVKPSVYELTVDVDTKSWQEAQEKAIAKLGENVNIKGFRKGKAPRDLIVKQLDQTKILEEAISVIINDVYRFALTESKVIPFLQPSYNITKLSDTELTLVFQVVSTPKVTLSEYKGLKLGHDEIEITDEEVTAKINTYLERGAELVLKETAAELGDTVIIDFEGFVDDVAFEGGKANNHELTLGSGQFIPGFEDALVGAMPGAALDVKVTFPDNYTEELKGKDAVFKTVVHEIKTKVLPELTDEYAASLKLANVTDVASLQIHVRYEVNTEKEQEARQKYIEKVLDHLREATTFEIADEIIHQEGHRLLDNFKNQVKQQGMEFDEYIKMVGETEEALHDKYVVEAEVTIKNFLVLEEIAALEGVDVTDADVDFEIAKMAQMYNMEEARIREILGDNLNNLRAEIKQKRTLDILVSENE